LLARLKRVCERFAELDQQEEFRREVDQFIRVEIFDRETALEIAQGELEEMCERFWWKPKPSPPYSYYFRSTEGGAKTKRKPRRR
jgi:hypothetical protein